MAQGDIVITVVGNLTGDPELRFTASGQAVASFTIASSARVLDKSTNEWKDGDTVFMRCNVWRQYAENVAESLTRGTRVIATGRLKQRSFETREGEKRTVMELEVDDVGPALRYSVAKPNKVARSDGGYGGGNAGGSNYGGGSGSGNYGGGSNRGSGARNSDDAWSAGPNSGGGSWGSGSADSDEPPF